MFTRLLSILPSLIGCVALSGCVNYLKQPAEWGSIGSLQKVDAAIEGSYACEGQILESNMGLWQEKHLGQYLFPARTSLPCDFVSLRRMHDDSLEVSAVKQGAPIARKVLAKGKDYEVDGGWLRIQTHSENAAEDIVAVRGSVSNSLTLDKDGNLVVQSKKFTIGLILIVPAFTAGQSWARFVRQPQ